MEHTTHASRLRDLDGADPHHTVADSDGLEVIGSGEERAPAAETSGDEQRGRRVAERALVDEDDDEPRPSER